MAELVEIYPMEVRKKRVRYYLIWLAINALVFAYIAVLLCIFHGSWGVGCVHKLLIWLLVYNIIQGLHIIRTFAIVCIWRKARDPSYT